MYDYCYPKTQFLLTTFENRLTVESVSVRPTSFKESSINLFSFLRLVPSMERMWSPTLVLERLRETLEVEVKRRNGFLVKEVETVIVPSVI